MYKINETIAKSNELEIYIYTAEGESGGEKIWRSDVRVFREMSLVTLEFGKWCIGWDFDLRSNNY